MLDKFVVLKLDESILLILFFWSFVGGLSNLSMERMEVFMDEIG